MISWMQQNNKFTVVVMWIAALSFILAGAVGSSMGINSSNIGKVGEVELKKDKFQMEYSNLFNRYNQMMQGKFDEKQAKEMGLQQQVINNMATQARILNLANEFGIVVSDKEIGEKLASYPAFQTKGVFDRKAYDTYLKNSGLALKTFENNLRDQLIIEKTLKLLNSKGLENEYKAFQIAFEVADKLKYEVLTPNDVNVTIDDEKLKAFWEPQKEQFKTPKEYTLAIQWTETKDTEVTDEEVKEYFEKNRFNYTDNDGKMAKFEDVKEWVKEATQVAKSKKEALKRYVAFKKGELSEDETLTLAINDPKLSPALWTAINSKNLNDILKPKVVENRYASVKIMKITLPITKNFTDVKESITPLYEKQAKQEALLTLAETKLTDIDKLDMNVSTFITLDNADTQKLGLNQQERANFISKLFTSKKEKGIIPIGSKVMVYKIIEQKLISLESNATDIMYKNADSVKEQSFQNNLIKVLNKKYPIELY